MPEKAVSEWMASLASTELALASLINSVAEKIDHLQVSENDALKVCEELRHMLTQVLGLVTERHKWVYQTLQVLNK